MQYLNKVHKNHTHTHKGISDRVLLCKLSYN